MIEVVHCNSQKEWDFVCEKLNRKSTVDYLEQNDNCCIELESPGCSWSISYCQKNKDIKIYSFEDWCRDNNYKPSPVNDKSLTIDNLVEGEIYFNSPYIFKALDLIGNKNIWVSKGSFGKSNFTIKIICKDGELKPATPEQKQWLEACIKAGKFIPKEEALNLSNKENLLEEAKRRYPVGTKFKVVHDPRIIYTVKSHDKYKNTFPISTWGNWFKPSTKEAYEAQFTEPESLVGRYIKALVNYPNAGWVKKGEIGKITRDFKNSLDCQADFPSQKSYNINFITYKDGKSYELLPKDYNPKNPDSKVNSDVLINNKGVKFIVGEKYQRIGINTICYYCGVNSNNTPVFELLFEKEGIDDSIKPKNWLCRGTNTYWGYGGIENELKELNDYKFKANNEIYPLTPEKSYKKETGFMKSIIVPKYKKESRLKIII